MPTRTAELRRGLLLEYATVGWNLVEGAAGLAAGAVSGSAALVAFALDSLVESASGGVLVWRLRAEAKGGEAEEVERRALRGVAAAFAALALYALARGTVSFAQHRKPESSPAGVAVAALALVVMPLLAWAKRRTAAELTSRALGADAVQTVLCALMSASLLAGLVANAALGWWWADPLAALVIAGIAAREGWELRRTGTVCS